MRKLVFTACMVFKRGGPAPYITVPKGFWLTAEFFVLFLPSFPLSTSSTSSKGIVRESTLAIGGCTSQLFWHSCCQDLRMLRRQRASSPVAAGLPYPVLWQVNSGESKMRQTNMQGNCGQPATVHK